MEKLTINAEKVCEFSNFQSWVNHASSWIGGARESGHVILCIDKAGNTCSTGADFMAARDANRFPVTAWFLLLSKDVTDVIIKESIGDKLKRIRKEKSLSQSNVAAYCGISQAAYAKIENGTTQNITIAIGKGIANVFLISFNELFEIETVQP